MPGSLVVSSERRERDLTFLKSRGPTLTAEQAAKFVLDPAVANEPDHRAYWLSAARLSPLSCADQNG
jgi:hypothetical protein